MRFEMKSTFSTQRQRAAGFTLLETMMAVLIAGLMFTALHACFACGFSSVKVARERLRATQVILRRIEGLRLCSFDQLTNTVINPQSFTEYYDPSGAGAGAIYNVTLTPAIPATGTVPDAYRTNMMLVTIAASWTSGNVEHRESMQTYFTRNGIDDYVVNGR